MTRRTGWWWAAAATGLAIALLVALGVWQLHRRSWKEGVLAAIARAEAAPPVPPPAEGAPPPFTRVALHGRWRSGATGFFGVAVRNERLGARRLAVIDLPEGRPVLLLDGWAPTETPLPPALSGSADVVGYTRLPEQPGLFSAADDLARKRFFTLDPTAIGAALGAPHVRPFTIVTDGAPALPPNNHLQYALTWFALALALAVMAALRARSAR